MILRGDFRGGAEGHLPPYTIKIHNRYLPSWTPLQFWEGKERKKSFFDSKVFFAPNDKLAIEGAISPLVCFALGLRPKYQAGKDKDTLFIQITLLNLTLQIKQRVYTKSNIQHNLEYENMEIVKS